jgi:quinol monooxygenase YgiN
MVIRIVKMTFLESKIDDFKEFAKTIEDTIRNFEGCEYLDILQDLHNRNIFFSYSIWKSEADLDNYRKSDFFKATWSKVRQWFGDRPKAWSVEKL